MDSARILIVDDDPKGQKLMGDLLSTEGHELAFAATGSAALEEATRKAPDVVLLDVLLPDMDGFEVCRHLRLDPILAEVPIILVTSLADRAARLRGLEAGADEFVTKPADGIELKTRVRNVVNLNRYRKLLQERAKAELAHAEVMSMLKDQSGRGPEPPTVEPIGKTIDDRQEPKPVTVTSTPAAVASAKGFRSRPGTLQRLSMSSAGARAQFFMAIALISVVPTLVMVYFCMSGWLGFQLSLENVWPLVVSGLPFVVFGYWMLAKYPVNIIRLRRYLESLTQGILPGRVELVTDENDLASIQTLMRTVIKQTEARIRTIQTQADALLDAERQRVMIQSFGAACHHLGQPATVIASYLQMMLRMKLPPTANAMLMDCRVAADELAAILERLQRLTVYRTESYLPEFGQGTRSQAAVDIVSV